MIGIAAPVSIIYSYDVDLANRLPEFFQLYQQEGDSIFFVAETRWDTMTPQYIMDFATGFEIDRYIEVYEAYFDKPLYVPNHHVGGPDDTTAAVSPVELYTCLMPNPAKEEVMVASSFKIRTVELYAADGKLLRKVDVNGVGTHLSLEGLPSGIYFVRVRTSGGVTTKRLVVE